MVNLDDVQLAIDDVEDNTTAFVLQEAFDELVWFRENFDELRKHLGSSSLHEHVGAMIKYTEIG